MTRAELTEKILAAKRARRHVAILFIDLDRGLVVLQGVEIAADPIVDVARHVHEMSGAGHRITQAVRIWLRALGSVGGLDRMDVQMDRAGMIWIARQHALHLLPPCVRGRVREEGIQFRRRRRQADQI